MVNLSITETLFFLALRKYRVIIAFDVTLILSTLIVVYMSPETSISQMIGLNLLCISIASYLMIIFNSEAGISFHLPDFKGIEFGFTNFLTGGLR